MNDQLVHNPCNPHPDAPHGFNRNASHDAGRYVCDCEGWEPEERDRRAVAGIEKEVLTAVQFAQRHLQQI